MRIFSVSPNFKNIINLFLVLIGVTASGLIWAESDQAWPETILIGGISTISAPPYGWIDPCDGKPVGSSRHILIKAFQELGVKASYTVPISFRSASWANLSSALNTGEIDAISGPYASKLESSLSLSQEPVTVIIGGVIYKKTVSLSRKRWLT